MLIFSLTVGIRKERRKKQQCQLQQWSLTVTAALAILSTVFFLIFFLPTINTLQADIVAI